MHYHLEETSVQQVQDGVFYAADVLIHVHPVVRLFLVKRFLGIVGIAISQEIPGRIYKGIHGIEFANRLLATAWAGSLSKGLGSLQWRISLAGELHIGRKLYRKILFLLRNPSALFTINHRNRAAPITLARNQPISQLVVHLSFAQSVRFQILGNLFNRFLVVHSGVLSGVNHGAFRNESFCEVIDVDFRILAVHNRNDVQVKFLRKLKVALVVRRNRHDGTGSVIHHNVIGDENRNPLSVYRVDSIASGEYAGLLLCQRSSLDFGLVLAFFLICFHCSFIFRTVGEFRYKWMFRRQNHVGYAEQRVRTSGINLKLLAEVLNLKGHLRTGGTANPVLLHQLYLFRPARHFVQILQQAIRIIGNLQIPLGQALLCNRRVATLTAAVYDLLVRQYGLTAWTPVHRIVLLVCQSLVVELNENPLHPLVIFFLTGSNLSIPVVAEAQALQLTVHFRNVAVRPNCRVNIIFNGRVFCRQSKGVPSHRMQNIVSLQSLETCNYVSDGVVPHMPHVQLAGRIWKHFQNIILFFVVILYGLERIFFFPYVLPLLFNFCEIVLFLHCP